ncbi:DUF4365 domain-containing protein [Nocardia nova]|uniref:DUF4365 domain-containing protein n=1 Tax=Nocardia nova TaxID=37330 RepID=UPI0025AEE0D8|nr:DUF4365 domain-containing protein [Nocardia nova]MDN2496602.1 DUF4365 domain-containing protein [Nocardia nova]
MRTNRNAIAGTAGQTVVKSQFEKLGWGAIANPEHDLGTDLVLMPRDERAVDWGLFCGAQVKSSPNSTKRSKYFKYPKKVDGHLLGWWFYEEKQDHFKYWIDHADAHFVVLHDLKAEVSYWALVTSEAVEWTDKGGKIFVPRHQMIDDSCAGELLAAASTRRGAPGWEGSAWTGAENLAPADRLRYALLAPRLIAPHPNSSPDKVSAVQAIATLVLGRVHAFDALPGSTSPYPRLEDITESSDWGLRLFAALHRAVVDGNADWLFNLIEQPAGSEHERIAATIIGAAFHLEAGNVCAAAALLDAELERDVAGTVDHAWLEVQRARVAREVGQLDAANTLATSAFLVRLCAPSDPTCLAISATASQILFSLAPLDKTTLSDTVIASDTAGAWWRSQVVSWGLAGALEFSFADWAEDGSMEVAPATDPSRHLRAASLISGFTGDHPGWCQAMSMLCRYVLLSDDDIDREQAQIILNDLRVSGDRDNVEKAVRKLFRSGPTAAVRNVASGVSLRDCSRSNLQASVALVVSGADVLTEAAAGLHAKWAMGTFRNPAETAKIMRNRYSPLGLRMATLDVLKAMTPIVSEEVVQEIIGFVVEEIEKPHEEMELTRLMLVARNIPVTHWTTVNIDRLKSATRDDQVLRYSFDQQFSAGDPGRQAELMAAAESGNLDTLNALSDIRKITASAAAAQIPSLRANILLRIDAAQRKEWSDSSIDHGRLLTVINMYRPEQADWEPIIALLKDASVYACDIVETIRRLSANPELVPPEVREALIGPLRQCVDGRRPNIGIFDVDISGPALEALDALAPGSTSDPELWALMGAPREGRRSLARILWRRRDEADLGTLLLLAHDRDVLVRGTAAFCIAKWAADGVGRPATVHALQPLIDSPGTHIVRQIVNGLEGVADIPVLAIISEAMTEHPSSFVRRWAIAASR